jgi:hypothetical protein
MSIISTIPNYGGRQPNNTSYIKQFVSGFSNLGTQWIFYTNHMQGRTNKTITPTIPSVNVLIQGDLNVNGTIYGTIATPSDITLKENISDLENLDKSLTENLMKIKPKKYYYKASPSVSRYGFIAQELEELYPELVSKIFSEKNNTPDQNNVSIKAIRYNDMIPLLLLKIQQMQGEIDELKTKIN